METKYCKYCNKTKDISCFSLKWYKCKECRNNSRVKTPKISKSLLTHRICKTCKKEKPIEEFRLVSSNGYKYPDTNCSICYNKSRKFWQDNYIANNKQEILERNRKIAKTKRYSYYRWRNLTSDQLKLVLRRQGCNDPCDSLLEAKKQQILLIRQIKQHEKN